MTPLERAARAVSEIEFYLPGAGGLKGRGLHVSPAWATEITRAVLLALREPSEAMISAMPQDRNRPIYAEDVWQAMIDAALEEG